MAGRGAREGCGVERDSGARCLAMSAFAFARSPSLMSGSMSRSGQQESHSLWWSEGVSQGRESWDSKIRGMLSLE